MEDRAASVRKYVIVELLAVVSVHSFLSEKPHVSFLVFFYGDHSPATETLLRVQVSVELGGSRKNR